MYLNSCCIKCRQSESGLGDCLVLMHVFFVTVLFISFLVRVPNRFEPRLKVQVMYVVWIGLVTRLTNTKNGSQEQRFRNMGNMKMELGTRSTTDSARVVY